MAMQDAMPSNDLTGTATALPPETALPPTAPPPETALPPDSRPTPLPATPLPLEEHRGRLAPADLGQREAAPDLPPSPSMEEIAAHLFAAFNRRDLSIILALVHPEVVFEPMTATVTRAGEPYRGHDGIRRYAEDVESHWAELTVHPTQIRAAGQAVVALGLVSGRGAEGSFEGAPTTWVMRFRDGLVVHAQIFSDERNVQVALANTV